MCSRREAYRVTARILSRRQGSDVVALQELRERWLRVRTWVKIRRRG
jgi:hypothetical protein